MREAGGASRARLHHMFAANIEQGENAENQDRPFLPAAHCNLVAEGADKNQHLQAVHHQQEAGHDIQGHRGDAREGIENVDEQNQPDKADGCFRQGNKRFHDASLS